MERREHKARNKRKWEKKRSEGIIGRGMGSK